MSSEPDILDSSQCWGRLRTSTVGRIAVVVDGGPAIRPVNFAVDRGTLLVRTGHGSLISRLAGERVAFEADGTEHAGSAHDPLTAWSVILEGSMRAVSSVDELLETFGVPLFPWHGAPKPEFLRMEPMTITGRRFEVAAMDTWNTPFDAMPHVAPE